MPILRVPLPLRWLHYWVVGASAGKHTGRDAIAAFDKVSKS